MSKWVASMARAITWADLLLAQEGGDRLVLGWVDRGDGCVPWAVGRLGYEVREGARG